MEDINTGFVVVFFSSKPEKLICKIGWILIHTKREMNLMNRLTWRYAVLYCWSVHTFMVHFLYLLKELNILTITFKNFWFLSCSFFPIKIYCVSFSNKISHHMWEIIYFSQKRKKYIYVSRHKCTTTMNITIMIIMAVSEF